MRLQDRMARVSQYLMVKKEADLKILILDHNTEVQLRMVQLEFRKWKDIAAKDINLTE
jgi:hypothetical protein